MLIKDRKILATRSIGKNAWYIPGGKRKGDRTDVEVLTREVEEMSFVNYDWKVKSSPINELIFDDLKTKDLID